MKSVDRLLFVGFVVIAGAFALPAVLPSLELALGLGTACFVVVRAVIFVTRR